MTVPREAAAAADALATKLFAGDQVALARAITLMEWGGEPAAALHRRIYPRTGRATVIGFTGPPGAGKSTLIDAYVAALRRSGRTVAIAAVDPSSPISGGALLGDRVRMGRHTEDPGVFIRSVAARGHLGGLSANIHRTIDAMDAAGRDMIVVETVGAGQSEIEIVEIADLRVVVNAPGLGDDIQAIKSGILEIADILVVNKSDLPNADLTARQLEGMLKLRDGARQAVPVLRTAASDGQGVDLLSETIDRLTPRGDDEKNRRRRQRIRRLIGQSAARIVRDHMASVGTSAFEALIEGAASGGIDIEAAARRALADALPDLQGGAQPRPRMSAIE